MLWKEEWNKSIVVDIDGRQGSNSEANTFGGLGPMSMMSESVEDDGGEPLKVVVDPID